MKLNSRPFRGLTAMIYKAEQWRLACWCRCEISLQSVENLR